MANRCVNVVLTASMSVALLRHSAYLSLADTPIHPPTWKTHSITCKATIGLLDSSMVWWLGCRTHHPQSRVMTLPGYFRDRWPLLAGKLSWDVTTTWINTALHHSGVIKSSTSFGWGAGRKVTAERCHKVVGNTVWSHMACDLLWECGDL